VTALLTRWHRLSCVSRLRLTIKTRLESCSLVVSLQPKRAASPAVLGQPKQARPGQAPFAGFSRGEEMMPVPGLGLALRWVLRELRG
jgi:hypothetical protein